MDTSAYVRINKLTDGSETFDVVIYDNDAPEVFVELHPATEAEARALLDELEDCGAVAVSDMEVR